MPPRAAGSPNRSRSWPVAASPPPAVSSWAGIAYCSGLVHDADGASTLLLDLSNALQITAGTGTAADIGTLVAGSLWDPSLTENTPVTTDSFEAIAEVPYRDESWLQATGRAFAAPLSSQQAALAAGHPLALVTTNEPFDPGERGFGEDLVAIRESARAATCAPSRQCTASTRAGRVPSPRTR